MTNSADPDQLASSEANWSGSTLFAKARHVVFSKRRVNCAQKHVLGTKYNEYQSIPENQVRNIIYVATPLLSGAVLGISCESLNVVSFFFLKKSENIEIKVFSTSKVQFSLRAIILVFLAPINPFHAAWRCYTHFKFPANQITWSRFLIQAHILNGKQCRSRSVGCLQRQGTCISGFSRTRVNTIGYCKEKSWYQNQWEMGE